jgi:hypothetical protein
MKFDEMKFPLDIIITKPSCTFKVATNSNFKNLLPMPNHRNDNVNSLFNMWKQEYTVHSLFNMWKQEYTVHSLFNMWKQEYTVHSH